jgi:hypothetical protein
VSTFTVKQLDDKPVLLTTLTAEFRVSRDMPDSDAATRAALETAAEPLFNVVDVRALTLTIDDVIHGSNRGSRGGEPIWKHPKIRQTIFISESKLVQMAAKGMNSAVFGHLDIRVFPNLEETLRYVDAQTAAPS